MVSMTALKYHTRGDQEHAEGSTYDVDESEVANLVSLRFAVVTATPNATKTKAAPVQPDAPVTRSTAVEPMTTDAAPLITPKSRNRTTAVPRPAPKARTKGKAKR